MADNRLESQRRSTVSVRESVAQILHERSEKTGIPKEQYVGKIFRALADRRIELPEHEGRKTINYKTKDMTGVKEVIKEKGWTNGLDALVYVLENHKEKDIIYNDEENYLNKKSDESDEV